MPKQDDLLNRASAVKARHEAGLLNHPGVVGVGVGYRQRQGEFTDEVAIVVMVNQKFTPDDLDPEDVLPAEIEGIPVDVQQTGRLTT